MSDPSDQDSTCSCTATLQEVHNLKSDTETYKKQVLIVLCVMAATILALAICVGVLFHILRKLKKLIKTLDPMSKYKRVGPGIYVKGGRKTNSSLSSSFQHFNTNTQKKTNDNLPDQNPETPTRNDFGTLDNNYFSKHNFNFQNEEFVNKDDETENSLSKRKTDSEITDTIATLDKVLY